MTYYAKFTVDKGAAIEQAVAQFRQSLTDLLSEGTQTFELHMEAGEGVTPQCRPCVQSCVTLVSVPTEQPK